MKPEHGVVINAPLEIRESDEGEHLVGTVIQEGRSGTERRELFTPQSLTWPAEGIPLRTTHLQGEVGRAIPTRHPGGEVRIRVKATAEIRAAYQAWKKFLSAEFFAIRESRAAGNIREIEHALLSGAAMVVEPEYRQATAEIRTKRKRSRSWL